MYLFPNIDMPKRAIDEAKKSGKEPDVMYALDLLGGYKLICKKGTLVLMGVFFGRCYWYLLGGWVRLRTGTWDVSYSCHGVMSRCRGVCGENREVSQGLYGEVEVRGMGEYHRVTTCIYTRRGCAEYEHAHIIDIAELPDVCCLRYDVNRSSHPC